MVRTQIQLTETQAKFLHDLAARKGVSIAELIRQSVDYFIQNQFQSNQNQLIENAKEAAGKYHAKVKDLAQNHDQYLAEDFNK
ncbi:MAG TPA: CopG family transcriptional regulator [Bacillota bacterium]|nr:CopG family transcriptional regulator [Bacillota bacterium]